VIPKQEELRGPKVVPVIPKLEELRGLKVVPVIPKLEELRGLKVVPVMLHEFDALLLSSLQCYVQSTKFSKIYVMNKKRKK